jgi:hypothetical protein
MGEVRDVYKILVRKPEVKRLFGRPVHRWRHNIKVGLKTMGLGMCTIFIWLIMWFSCGLLGTQ